MSNSRKEFTAVEVENCVPERERVHQALIDLIEHDKKYDLVFDILTEDKGIRKTVHSIAEIERDALGNPSKISGVVSDITERKQAEDEIKKHQDHLEELVKERTKNLEGKNKELERFNDLFVDREFRIKELRDEINELKNR